MKDRSSISDKLISVSNLINIEWDNNSYYMNHKRISESEELLKEICEDIEDFEDDEVIYCMHNYVKEILEQDEEIKATNTKHISNLILNGLASKIENPNDFTGYNTLAKKSAENIGVDISDLSQE